MLQSNKVFKRKPSKRHMFRKPRDSQISYQCIFKPLKGQGKKPSISPDPHQHLYHAGKYNHRTRFDPRNLKRISATHRKQNANRSGTISCNLSLSSEGFPSAAFNPALTLLPSHQRALQLLAFWFSSKCLQASSAELGKRLLLCLRTGEHSDHVWPPPMENKTKTVMFVNVTGQFVHLLTADADRTYESTLITRQK